MNTTGPVAPPLNIKDPLKASFFSKEETAKLIMDYSQQCSVEVSEEVVGALYDYTQGYPGLWSLCARAIADSVKPSQHEKFGLTEWTNLTSSGIILDLLQRYRSTSTIIDEFLSDREFGKKMKSVYLDFLLSGETKITMDPSDKGTIFLANLGLLVPFGDFEMNTFTTPPRILQDFVTVYVLRHFTPPCPVPPPNHNVELDVLNAVINTVKHLDYKSLQRALNRATKPSGLVENLRVLKETVYAVEFIAVLRAWLPLDFAIIPEVNCQTNEAGILIRGQKNWAVLKFLSNERYELTHPSSMLSHIEDAKKYGDELGAEAWIIHFVSVPSFPSTHEFLETPSCSCVYVYHLHDFSSVRVVSKDIHSVTTVNNYNFLSFTLQ